MEEINLISYLGENSYPAILQSINESLERCQPDTLRGKDLVNEIYKNLNESKTPILELKKFTTNAQQVASDDAKLCDIIEFCRKKVKSGDLNFLINLCKEEHYENMKRSGVPAPEETIKSIQSHFNEPSSVIEAGIRNGLFDNLDSKLLNEIKDALKNNSKNTVVNPEDIDKDLDKPLNESNLNDVFIKGISGAPYLISYAPVGITCEDVKNNRMLLLTESDVLTYDNEKETFQSLNESELKDIEIPNTHKRLMQAITSLAYNPETSVFSLNENWDFNIGINPDSTMFISKNDKTLPFKKEDLKEMLLESIQTYKANPLLVSDFNYNRFLADADNFIMLAENHNRLIKFDKLRVIRNLNENQYIILDKEKVFIENTPEIVASSKGRTKLFESFRELVEEVNQTLNESVSELFVENIKNDDAQLNIRNKKIVELTESQRTLNEGINKVKELKNLCESDSPAFDELNIREQKLNESLNQVLDDLNFYKNEFKLH